MKEALLNKYMEKNPSAADVIDFLSIIDNNDDILSVYNSLPQDIRDKLATLSFVDVVSWLRDFSKANFYQKEEMFKNMPIKKDLGVEVLDRDLRSNSLIMKIEDNVFRICIGNIYYTYNAFDEKIIELNDVRAIYLMKYKDYAGMGDNK